MIANNCFWTPERIVAAMQTWEQTHGRPPTTTEWIKATPWTPSAQTVYDRFGTWNFAMATAGFTPRRTGPRKLIGEAA